MKQIINLIVDVNKEIAISLLNILNNYSIASFKSNTFKTIMIFNEILFEIEMKLNKSLISFSTIAYLF